MGRARETDLSLPVTLLCGCRTGGISEYSSLAGRRHLWLLVSLQLTHTVLGIRSVSRSAGYFGTIVTGFGSRIFLLAGSVAGGSEDYRMVLAWYATTFVSLNTSLPLSWTVTLFYRTTTNLLLLSGVPTLMTSTLYRQTTTHTFSSPKNTPTTCLTLKVS